MDSPLPASGSANAPSAQPSRDLRVYAEQVAISYSQLTLAALGSPTVGILLVWIFWEQGRHAMLLGWLSAIIVANALRLASKHFFERRADNRHIRRWGQLFAALSVVTGIIWAVAWLTFPGPDPMDTVIVCCWMLGISAAAISAYAAHIPGLLAFCVPVIVPEIVHLFLLDGRTNLGLALGLCFYCLVMLKSVLRINASIVEAITANFALEEEIEERKKTEEQLHTLSTKDGLTGLANRRRFDEVLDQELRRARRQATTLSLVMIDIDCFKAFNDHYGHLAGDDTLRQAAAVVEDGIRRPGDLAARYGGEEFAVILPDTPGEAAVAIVESIRATVEAQRIPHAASSVGTGVVTLSAGVSTTSEEVEPAELIGRADAALYRAKSEGRNRVVVAAPPEVSPASPR